MFDHGFKRLEVDHCVYIKWHEQEKYIILLLYEDGMLIVGHDKNMINRLKKDLGNKFSMKDLGPTQQILGMKIIHDRNKKSCGCHKKNILRRCFIGLIWRMQSQLVHPLHPTSNEVLICALVMTRKKEEISKTPYASAVGSLMHAMVCTQPNIAHLVGVVSRLLTNLGKHHWEEVKWILRYLKGTSHHYIWFDDNNIVFEVFIDANVARYVDTRNSTTGYLYTFVGTVMSWVSTLQRVVSLSIIEAEYIAATEACKEMLWMQWFLGELGIK